jgi:hypothetical protein
LIDPAYPPPGGVGVRDFEKNLPNFSFASQNLRSLNISTKNNITKEKIYAVTKENADIIFICDLKLNSTIQKAAVHDVEKYFFLAVGSVYGPNQNEHAFFDNLNNFIARILNSGVILGGDWNLT